MNLLALAVLLVVGDGAIRRASGRGATVDTDTLPLTLSGNAEDHLKHWPAPESGSVVSLTLEISSAGTTASAGTMTYVVQPTGGPALCSLTISCDQAEATFPTISCEENAVDEGVHLDVVALNEGCDTRPAGTLTAVYLWRP